jgi:hypothetical protein
MILALMLGIPGATSAQERFGTLTGQVLDSQGAVLPGATITANFRLRSPSASY